MPSAKASEFVPLSVLAPVFGYTQDHLAYLCRTGEVEAKKEGRTWLTTEPALRAYQDNIKAIQKERWDEMSRKQRLGGSGILGGKFLGKVGLPRSRPKRASRTWDEVVAGGIDSAVKSFTITFRMLFLPIDAALEMIHIIVRLGHLTVLAPALVAGGVSWYWEFATREEVDLYERYRQEMSLFRIHTLTKRAERVVAAGISIFIFAVFTFSVLNMFSVSVGQAMAQLRHPQSAFAFSQSPQIQKVIKQDQSLLVRDYLMLDSNPYQSGVEPVGGPRVAGDFIAYVPDYLDSINEFLQQRIDFLTSTVSETADQVLSFFQSIDAGFGRIRAGELEAVVREPDINESSIIFVEFLNDLGDSSVKVSEQVPSSHFTVLLEETFSQDVYFQYWIVHRVD